MWSIDTKYYTKEFIFTEKTLDRLHFVRKKNNCVLQ